MDVLDILEVAELRRGILSVGCRKSNGLNWILEGHVEVSVARPETLPLR